ncbi:MAG: N-acetylneuraminate synthase family protein [Candidatus Margulisbacteria bacterium]|nr:N-acetylneuraminate synthase family protein [Candidatus Margulisiibacteriota bacterium]MBU1021538.1 N-acetylneuraminate synthase family protein [Candidatus Margulisiibacteriota bacterium]MBU1728624.1 N-acetylneuraminate synthase family protein [Candidatus Margulisiibacteriota bacterium]MBU1955075.1 N-acetylneuraminate synthase family protein [Candidatus Margulisiibacteriota bacterium]
MEKEINLGNGVKLGGENHCVILLDAGVNHNNDVARAKLLMKTAKDGGADAIKFQTYTAGGISTRKAPRYWDPKLDTDGGGSQYDMFKKVDALPKAAYYELKDYAKKLKIAFTSSPFDMESARFLIELDVDFYKIASAEVTNLEMIQLVAETGKPIILSTGACTIDEVKEALQVIFKTGNRQVALQHCVLSYPCKDEDANLAKMTKLKQLFPDLPVGYSDHTLGTKIPLAAIALGAKSIEKHYTVDKSLPDSPDHGLSLSADELPGFIHDARQVEASIGVYHDGFYQAEEKACQYARKSIVAVKPIRKGTKITAEMLSCKRPGTGIYPKFLKQVVGKEAKIDIAEDAILQWDMV